MGRAAFFIRLFGCPLHCPFCDSAGTWHPDYVPKHVEKFSVEQLVAEAKESGAKLVVITGGEPAIHNLTALTAALQDQGHSCAIETSGAYLITGSFDTITVSPKDAKPALRSSLLAATELKLIITKPDDIERWLDFIRSTLGGGDDALFQIENVWLHPEWSQRENPAVLNAITNAVVKYGDPVRAGYQMHKLYRADLLDARSAPSAPLGGITERIENKALD